MAKKGTRGAVAPSQVNSNKTAKISQEDKILMHLQKYGSITSMTAFRTYGITRLAAVIFKLRKRGYWITTSKGKSPRGEWYGIYHLREEKGETA